MVYSLTYCRPPHVRSLSQDSLSGDEKQESINESLSETSSIGSGIPRALSFDRIIAGGVCPPCSVRDFMNYLKYIEHSAENLQFYLWLRDYTARWKSLPESERVLAPEWTHAQAKAQSTRHRPCKIVSPAVAAVLKGTDFGDSTPKSQLEGVEYCHTTEKPSPGEEKPDLMSEYGSSIGDEPARVGSLVHHSMAGQAFDDAGMKWKPCLSSTDSPIDVSTTNGATDTVQPYREEVNRIVGIYIAESGPRELNLSGRERQAVMHALQNTTHPSAFKIVLANVSYSLRKQSHPNFIRWTICNGNRPRVIFGRGLGVAGIAAGFLGDLLLTLSHASRGWRALPFIGWFLGIATLIAALKGMCVVLHGMHHRHLRPWELFSDEPEDVRMEKVTSYDTLVNQSSNSFEDEPWVARYKKRNIVRKVFDREIWIQEPALRQIQDTIFLQAVLTAFVMSGILVLIFLVVPRGNLY